MYQMVKGNSLQEYHFKVDKCLLIGKDITTSENIGSMM